MPIQGAGCCSLAGFFPFSSSFFSLGGHLGLGGRLCNIIGGEVWDPSAVLGVLLAPPDNCSLGVSHQPLLRCPQLVTQGHSLDLGVVVAPQNSAISPPSLATLLAFGGPVHPLRSASFSQVILGLGSPPETLGVLPSQRSQPCLCPSLGNTQE